MTRFGRRVGGLLLAASMVAGALAPSCAKQGEGERCDKTANDSGDCEAGLECIASSELADTGIGDRCCPEAGKETDDRCIRKVGGTGGTGGTDGSAGTGGTAGADAADGAGGTAGSAGSGGSAGSDAAAGSAGASGSAGSGGAAGSDASTDASSDG